MKTLVTRSLALLLTLALLFTVTPFTALAEAAKTDDGMDENMSILETIDEDSEEISVADVEETEEQPAVEEASEGMENIEDYESGPDLPDESDDCFLPDDPDAPGVEDDWADWYPDDTPEEEPEQESSDEWFEEGSDDSSQDSESEAQEGTDSLEHLVMCEYNGSSIRYAIENYGHAYVKTKQAAPVYRDSGLNPGAVLCMVSGGEILLATDYEDHDGIDVVSVMMVTAEMDVVEGYIRESDLSEAMLEDEEIEILTVERDFLMIDVNGESYPVLISSASFYGTVSESETDGKEADENDDEYGEESEADRDDSESGETLEGTGPADEETTEDEPETVTLDLDVQEIQPAAPVRLMATRSYTYTIYADHDPAIPISTRPVAYMAGNRQGFTTIDQGNDGSDFRSIHQSYNMKGQQVTVLGFTRYHHAVITCEWYDSSAGVTRRLLTEAAYMRPVAQTYSCTVRDDYGNIVPNHEVRVLDGKCNYVTTVLSDANGVARYTGPHLEVSAMLAFAEANYTETSSNTMIEDNDCASFVSECLTAGGFPVYGAYASNSEANEGQIGYGLYDRLVSWIGVPGTSYPSVSQLSPGDVVFMHPQNSANYPYGHSMIIGQVDYASGQVLVYGHSSANKQAGDSNKMWISVGRIAYAAFTSIYNYTFDYSFSTPTPPPTNPPTQPPTNPPTNPPTRAAFLSPTKATSAVPLPAI